MAKNDAKKSTKGKAKASPHSKSATAAVTGSGVGKAKATTAKTKVPPKAPAQFKECATTADIIACLQRMGADADMLKSVAMLRPAPTTATSAETPTPTQQQPNQSCKRLIRLLTQFVQYERQLDNWDATPKFLAAEIGKTVNNISPPGKTAAYTATLQSHADEFCRAVVQTTQLHLTAELKRVTDILVNWEDAAVVKEATEVARRRIYGQFGDRDGTRTAAVLFKTAVALIPRDLTRPWPDTDMELEEASAGPSTLR